MKSAQCRTRWHDRCGREIENVDGSAYICECDCHAALITQISNVIIHEDMALDVVPQWMGPPPHPLPFDHGKYRIAEEPPGTDLTLPWQETFCVECRERTWTHNQRSVERQEAICESCYYMMVSDHYDELAKRQRGWNNNQPPPIGL